MLRKKSATLFQVRIYLGRFVLDSISGFIENIVYISPENGFTIARFKEEHKKELTTILGYFPSIQPGESLTCRGTWKSHPKHGKQLEVADYEITAPSDLIGIRKYLESGLIKGIGPVYAKKIIQKFKERTLEILDQTPYRLLEIEGIGEKKIESIIQCWSEQKSIRNVMIFLRKHEVSPAFAQKIFKAYGDKSIEQVQKNPYQLAKDVFGIGFKMADTLAKNLGFDPQSSERIQAAIEFLLWELSTEGHTCYPKEKLVEKSSTLLEIEPEEVGKNLDALLFSKSLFQEERVFQGEKITLIWLQTLYTCEKGIAKELDRLLRGISAIRTIDKSKAISWVEEKLAIAFAEKQKEAILESLSHKVHILTGGPGTGKTTITKALLTILGKLCPNVLLCAPTGRAAKRLSQITRKKAFTIHSLLEMDFSSGGFKRGKDNPLTCEFLIIDEASMIDTFLLYHLLLAIPTSAKVLFIGDIDQLPSVGPGQTLKDLIQSGVISVSRLEEIFRQASYSRIILNAHRINQGNFPDLFYSEKSDFRFDPIEDPEKIQERLIHLAAKELPSKKNLDPFKDIQILSPMKKGSLGTEKLNLILQQTLNPCKTPFYKGGRCFHPKDKVMQIKNNYQKNVFNGDVGFILYIDMQEQKMIVTFDQREVEYEFSELDEITLAYAVSVHKYQGSECPCILMPIHTSHFILLYRNLLYTAVTRGKKLVVIVGSKKAVALAIKNQEVYQRFTGLEKMLQEMCSNSPSFQLEGL